VRLSLDRSAQSYAGSTAMLSSRRVAHATTLLAVLLLAMMYLHNVRSSPFVDFEAYYAGATALWQGDRLYGRALAYRDSGYAISHPAVADPNDGRLPYVYPPAFALAFSPLALLPERAASMVWFTFVFGCLMGTVWLLTTGLVPIAPSYRLATALGSASVVVLFQPARSSLWCAQADIVLLLLVVLSLVAFVRGHDGRTGVLLGVAMAVKPFLGFLLLFLLWKRAYRAGATAIGVASALFVVPALMLGAGTLADFVQAAAYWSSSSFAVSPINQSPYGLSLRLLTANAYTVPIVDSPMLAGIVRVATVVVALLVLARSVGRSRSEDVGVLSLEYGLAIVAMLFVAPLAQDIYYLYLLVSFAAVALALKRGRAWSMPSVLLGAGAVVAYLYLSLPSLRLTAMGFYAFYAGPISGPSLLFTGVHVYGLTLVALLTMLTLRWYRHSVSEDPPVRLAVSRV
jgi:hypothetical protein